MKKDIYITIKLEIDDNNISLDIVNVENEVEEPRIPHYTGPLSCSISTGAWIACTSDETITDWSISYTE